MAGARKLYIALVILPGLGTELVFARMSSRREERVSSHLSQIDVSQQGNLTALTATRLHRPQRSFAGISSGTSVLLHISLRS